MQISEARGPICWYCTGSDCGSVKDGSIASLILQKRTWIKQTWYWLYNSLHPLLRAVAAFQSGPLAWETIHFYSWGTHLVPGSSDACHVNPVTSCWSALNESVCQWQSLTRVAWWGLSWGSATAVVLEQRGQLAVRVTLIKNATAFKAREQLEHREIDGDMWGRKPNFQVAAIKGRPTVKTFKSESREQTRLKISQGSIISYSVCRTCVWADGWEQMHRLDDI